MTTPYDAALFLYNLTLIPMVFFSILLLLLTLLYLVFVKDDTRKARLPKELPFVSVQIPTFNDPIAARCVEHCLAFDYPQDRYEIIIADDSTNAETRALLRRYARENRGRITYVHRKNREGYKPGALRDAMKHTRGEIIVLFDADWLPQPGFLKEVIRPFSDPLVAVVQTRQGFYNHTTNLITRFAAYVLMTYHTVVMPLNQRINTVLFCGTAGAIRRSAFEAVGGWNVQSITEDSDLTVRLLIKGYRTAYLDVETPSEVPDTFEGFIRQQMRWCYGNTRVFIDHAPSILYKRGLTFRQRLMITYLTLGNVIAPIVVLMTVFGLSGWFLGNPGLFSVNDVVTLAIRFCITAGFLVIGTFALWRLGRLREFKYLVMSTFTIGIVLSVANSIAFTKAVFNSRLEWFCTPKHDNVKLVDT